MAKPIAYFGYSKVGKTVNFVNNSLNNPTSYLWDFGDGDTSIDKSPSHTYSDMGFFTVTLLATNGEGDSEPLTMVIGIGDTEGFLNASIIALIEQYLPEALRGEVTMPEKVNLITKWQLYLQPLVVYPQKVKEEDTHNEFKWPGLVNNLIALLVVYDLILMLFNRYLAAGALSSIGSGSSEEDGGNDQQIKSIETGPAKTEWHENRSSSEQFLDIGKILNLANKEGGILAAIQESICQQSSRLRIFLPICGQLEHNTIAPTVACKTQKGGHNANPFGITKRML